MGTRSFFVDPGAFDGDRVELQGQVAHQIRSVLRLRGGDALELLDGSGYVYLVRILDSSREAVIARVEGRRDAGTEPRLKLDLYQSLLKGEKMELVLQKGTEIGVSRFMPVLSERCISRPTASDLEKRLPRWRAIVREAAEQSGRAYLPEVTPLKPFEVACREASATDLAIVAWEGEHATGIGRLLAESGLRIGTGGAEGRPWLAMMVGPEGGFSPEEIEVARLAGVRVATLGSRILRAETAALVSATLALQATGDLGE